MKKLRNIIVSSITLASFLACSPPLIDNVNPSTSANPSSSASISSSSSPVIAPTPTPTATPGLAPGEYRYDTPLSISNFGECSPGETAKKTYEIKSDGSFIYKVNENGAELSKEKKLSSAELADLKSTLQESNIAKLAEADQLVKPGTPQTTECRTIETININVNSKEKPFDRNGRQFIHSKEYFEALSKIKSKVEELKTDVQGAKYIYSLPITISNMNECNANMSDRDLYDLKADRTFTYIISENDLTKSTSRKLTESEFNSFKDLLKTTDIATLAEADTSVAAGSPQTAECRTVENTQLFVNGTYKTYDKNSRKLNHTQAYIDALNKIKARFSELAIK